MTDAVQPSEEDEALVAEYVVGVLPLQERRALEERMARDPAVRRQIEVWEARLEDLNKSYGQLDAPRAVKARIDRQLFKNNRRFASPWGWLLAAATGLVSALIVIAVLVGTPQNADLQATLDGETGAFVVALDMEGGALDITRTAPPPPEGSVFELWVVRPEQPPQSLGTFLSAGTLQLHTALADGETLAVSIEPTGGSPSGSPTGPVIATGVLEDV